MLIVSDNSACNIADTISKPVYVLSNSTNNIEPVTKCVNESTQIGLSPFGDLSTFYMWSPSTNLSQHICVKSLHRY